MKQSLPEAAPEKLFGLTAIQDCLANLRRVLVTGRKTNSAANTLLHFLLAGYPQELQPQFRPFNSSHALKMAAKRLGLGKE